ncbi:MAG TPA: hypothetical protein VFT43_09595, partial [Candidatus Polarisedimenticolia bacterium]|nr:hypothetical protein [Candidatus Polarisedimenticolia bacterium]
MSATPFLQIWKALGMGEAYYSAFGNPSAANNLLQLTTDDIVIKVAAGIYPPNFFLKYRVRFQGDGTIIWGEANATVQNFPALSRAAGVVKAGGTH